MTTYTYPDDFSALDWTDLPSLSADDIVDGGGATFTARLTIPAAGVTWQNFEIALAGSDSNAIAVTSMDDTTVQDVVFGGSTGDGITQGNPALSVDGLTLTNVTSQDNGGEGYQLGHSTGGGCTNLSCRGIAALRNVQHGVYIRNSPSASLQSVTVTDSGATGNVDGLAIDDGCGGTVVRDVVVTGQVGGSSIDIQDSTDSTEIKLTEARATAPNGATSEIDGISVTGTAPALVYGCVVDAHRNDYLSKSMAAHQFYNITSVNPTGNGVRIGLGTAGALTLKNAIISGAAASNIKVVEAGSTLTSDYNLFDTTPTYDWKTSISTDIAGWRTDSSQDANSTEVADPEFISTTDFRLEASSPAVGAGTHWWRTGAPTELVTNGTFDSDVTGWGETLGVTLAWSAGRMELTSTDTTVLSSSDAITMVVGHRYRLSADIYFGDITSCRVITDYATTNTLTESGSVSVDMVATDASTTVTIVVVASGAGETVEVDNISLMDITDQPLDQSGLRFPLRAGQPDIGAHAVRPGEDGATRKAYTLPVSYLEAGSDLAKSKAA